MTIKNLETVNVLFMLVSIMLWNTIQWHENQKFKNLLYIGLSVGLMGLVKPSEVLMIFVPILWNVQISFESIKNKIALIFKHWKQFALVVLIVLIVVSPQLIYWYTRTGQFIYDSYKNPGIGLDLRHPHLIESLFSYRKGWLVYTPIMIFFLVGFYFLFKRNRSIFYAVFLPFLLSFYIVTCWTEWWYGAGFSNRPVITYYPLLCIPFGYLLMEFERVRFGVKIIFGSVVLFFVFLNQFQWWQLKNYILDNYLMTKEYYWKTFLKTTVTEKDKELLMVERNFSGINIFKNKENYIPSLIVEQKFNNLSDSCLRTNLTDEFYPLLETEYNKLTTKDHVWLEISFDLKFLDTMKTKGLFFCTTMERIEGVYGYLPVELDTINSVNGRITMNYLTPEIRNNKDRYKCYFWNRDKVNVTIDNFKVMKFEAKQ